MIFLIRSSIPSFNSSIYFCFLCSPCALAKTSRLADLSASSAREAAAAKTAFEKALETMADYNKRCMEEALNTASEAACP
jgi:hypothetical protein